MRGNAPDINIGAIVNSLRSAGVRCVDVFEKKLTQNGGNSIVIRDLSAEGAAALMFASAGFRVEMSDAPTSSLNAPASRSVLRSNTSG